MSTFTSPDGRVCERGPREPYPTPRFRILEKLMSLPTNDAVFERSRQTFDSYCAMGDGQLPANSISRRQVLETRVGSSNAPAQSVGEMYRVAAFAFGQLGLHVDNDGVAMHKRRLVASFVRLTVGALMRICSAARLDFGELCAPDDP
jgi:hypothetical protein